MSKTELIYQLFPLLLYMESSDGNFASTIDMSSAAGAQHLKADAD